MFILKAKRDAALEEIQTVTLMLNNIENPYFFVFLQ